VLNWINALWAWYKKKYLHMDMTGKIEKLRWMKHDLRKGQTFDWDYVDTVDFDIKRVKTRQELVLDMIVPQREEVAMQIAEKIEQKGGGNNVLT
jgi:hypothetical protein